MTDGREPAEPLSLNANSLGLVEHVGDTLAGWLLGSTSPDQPNGSLLEHWEIATWLAYWQRAVPWLLSRAAEDDVRIPEAALSRLRQVDRSIRAGTNRLLGEAAEILAALHNAGVQAIPLKGILLAAGYYRDPGSRAMRDIDLLVPIQDTDVVSAVLTKLQYRRLKVEPKSQVWVKGTSEPETWSPDHLRPVDVHTRSVDDNAYRGFDLDPLLWNKSSPAPLPGLPEVQVLAPSALLVHPAVHASNNALRRDPALSHLRDLQTVGRRLTNQDWTEVIELLEGGASRIVYPSLALLDRYAPGVIPADIFEYIEDRAPRRLRAWIERNGYGKSTRTSYSRRDLAGRVLSVVVARSHLVSGWREWLRFAAGVAFPDRSGILKSHRWANTPLWPLAYAQRRISRVWEVGKAATLDRREADHR